MFHVHRLCFFDPADRCADLTEQAKKAGLKFKVDMLVTPGSELVSVTFSQLFSFSSISSIVKSIRYTVSYQIIEPVES